MSLDERLRNIGISADRRAALAIGRETNKPTPTALASLAARLTDTAVQADLSKYLEYRNESDAYRRVRLRIENGPAIDRGFAIDQELPEQK